MNVLVIGAHPDDEVVGMGATIKKLSKTNKIFLCIITDGTTAQYDIQKVERVVEMFGEEHDRKLLRELKDSCINFVEI